MINHIKIISAILIYCLILTLKQEIIHLLINIINQILEKKIKKNKLRTIIRIKILKKKLNGKKTYTMY